MNNSTMIAPAHIRIIEEALGQRKEKNARYSLRAFAAFLDLHPSALSRLLSGKQDLSVRAALLIMRKLKLTPLEQERFIVSVVQEISRQALAELKKGVDDGFRETALVESEERYRALFDIVDQSVSIAELIRDENGKAIDARMIRMNRHALDAIGLASEEEAVGLRLTERHPEAVATLLPLFERAVQDRQTVRLEQSFPDIDRHYDLAIVPTEGDRFMTLGTDVTERRKHELALKANHRIMATVLEMLPVAVGVVNLKGEVTILNAKMREYLPNGKLPSLDDEHGHRWTAVNADGTTVSRSEFPSARALRGEPTIPGLEMQFQPQNGKRRSIRVTSVPVRDETGNLSGAVSVITDLDQLHAVEAALENFKKFTETRRS